MMKNTYYMPLTAAPFKQDEKYRERLPQNAELTKYVRCFWGSERPYLQKEKGADVTIVIPDTCVDIIYNIDYTENTITGGFCGINDASFWDYGNTKKSGHLVSVFAIRFFAWGAYAFSEDSMKDTINSHQEVQTRFYWLDKILRQQLFEVNSLEERGDIVEELLLGRLFQAKHNNVIDSAVGEIILRRGTLGVAELADECFVSSRQLERLFHEYIGITPKKLSSIVRYQCLWNEILINSKLHILDAVCKYGFTDQSHLIREFKRYHAMDIGEARLHACGHAHKNVENIQDFPDRQ